MTKQWSKQASWTGEHHSPRARCEESVHYQATGEGESAKITHLVSTWDSRVTACNMAWHKQSSGAWTVAVVAVRPQTRHATSHERRKVSLILSLPFEIIPFSSVLAFIWKIMPPNTNSYLSGLTKENLKQIWKTSDAVCFDVDSTVVQEEGIDELAEFCGVGDKVKQW